jgi:hypothetical protein
MKNLRLLVLLSVVTSAGCQGPSSVQDLSQADITAIRATSERWMAAVHAGRWDDAAETYTAGAIVWFPNATYEGRVAIRKFLETMQPWTLPGLCISTRFAVAATWHSWQGIRQSCPLKEAHQLCSLDTLTFG